LVDQETEERETMLGNKGGSYRAGGTRGGHDQFKWEDVKGDKNREFYLGHSTMAPTGRWQNGKDVLWYTKSKTDQDAALAEERDRIRRQEEEAINAKVGVVAPLLKRARPDEPDDLKDEPSVNKKKKEHKDYKEHKHKEHKHKEHKHKEHKHKEHKHKHKEKDRAEKNEDSK